MLADSRFLFLLVGVLLLGSHMAQANASLEEDEGRSGMDTIVQPNADEDFSGDDISGGPDDLELPDNSAEFDNTEL